jgi:hypothetical protein
MKSIAQFVSGGINSQEELQFVGLEKPSLLTLALLLLEPRGNRIPAKGFWSIYMIG